MLSYNIIAWFIIDEVTYTNSKVTSIYYTSYPLSYLFPGKDVYDIGPYTQTCVVRQNKIQLHNKRFYTPNSC